MKLILFTTVILLAAIVKANLRPPGALAEAIAKCTEETGAASDIIEKIRNHDLSFDDAKGKCFLKCLCTKLGVCDGDYKLVGKTFTKHSKLLAEKVEDFLSNCNALKGENDCETVHGRLKCLFDKVPEIVANKVLGLHHRHLIKTV